MKKKRKTLYRTALFLFLLVLSGCYYDVGLVELPPDTVVSFAQDVQPILTVNCTSCHPPVVSPDLSAGNSFNAITNDNYIVPNDLEASVLYQKLLGNPNIMPPSGALPNSQITLIRTWIEQGALNN